MYTREDRVALLAEKIWDHLPELESGEAYYRDVLGRTVDHHPDTTVLELFQAILRVQARATCFRDGPDTVQ